MLEAAEADDFIRVVVGGRLHAADYHGFVPLFERVAARNPRPVPLLIELAPDFSGWTPRRTMARFEIRREAQGQVRPRRYRRHQEMARMGHAVVRSTFPTAEMRFFAPEQCSEAEAWVRSGER